ncbi:hypothetical protein [Nonomuraea guangzhouensis]|uniref:ABC transporter permease n=1 Tax=Nonomuraea guangzhouensis TaxID=1291555 RepID=A0ABW4G837_9ACTN|nr:hypothetical protein [Nonomuraea guangzhouensis]
MRRSTSSPGPRHTRPVIAKALSRWGHLLQPIVLIALGLLILIQGGAFGL